jgi:hypothetical protein
MGGLWIERVSIWRSGVIPEIQMGSPACWRKFSYGCSPMLGMIRRSLVVAMLATTESGRGHRQHRFAGRHYPDQPKRRDRNELQAGRQISPASPSATSAPSENARYAALTPASAFRRSRCFLTPQEPPTLIGAQPPPSIQCQSRRRPPDQENRDSAGPCLANHSGTCSIRSGPSQVRESQRLVASGGRRPRFAAGSRH